jgi:hypothetical protein
MQRYFFAVLVMSVMASASLAETVAAPAGAPVVSVVQLIATPEKFDGKLISVIGFLRLEHDGYLIYLGKEDYDNVVLANALWVDATEEMGKNREKLELKYVKIIGTFRAGHEKRNLFSSGGITDIKSCQFWSDPANPLENRIKAMHKEQ